MRPTTSTMLVLIAIGSFSAVAYAAPLPPWRTPPAKTIANETVSCDLLNNSGGPITVSNLVINVRALEDATTSQVVFIPGPATLADGRGFRGSSPVNFFGFRTVYCEIDPNSVISVKDKKLMFTMTMGDNAGNVTTVAIPRK